MDINIPKDDLEGVFLTSPYPDIDFMELEMQQREFLYELQRKRKQLDECRQELYESVAKQHEFQRELQKQTRKNESNHLQMTTLASIAKASEEERQNDKEGSNKLKVQLEILSAEREALVKQNRALQQENLKLKRELDDAEGKNKCHSAFQKDILDQQAKIHGVISQIASSHKNLATDMEYLKNKETELEKFLDLKLYAEQCEAEKDKAIQNMNNMEKQLIMNKAELDTFKELISDSPLTTRIDEEILNFWKERAKELQQLLKQEAENSWKLSTALEIANETRLNLEKSYEAVVNKLNQN